MKPINNEEMIETMSQKTNIEKVEFLLESKNCALESIASKIDSENLDFGHPVERKEFWKIYCSVSKRVESFLDICSVINPNILLSQSYNDEYDQDTTTIRLNNSKKKILIPSLAHEYTHHICYVKGIDKSFSFFEEGIARGIEREIARQFTSEEKDCTYLYEITEEDAAELCKTHLWLCDIHDKKPKKSLLKFNPEEEFLFTYCIGNSYFLIDEIEKGKETYKNIFG